MDICINHNVNTVLGIKSSDRNNVKIEIGCRQNRLVYRVWHLPLGGYNKSGACFNPSVYQVVWDAERSVAHPACW